MVKLSIGRKTGIALGAMVFVACAPEFDDRPSSIGKTSSPDDIRILAIASEPAEWTSVLDPDTGTAKPATYSALVVTRAGTVANANLDWAFCTQPKPLTELNDVSIKCFQNDPSFIVPVGSGPSASAAIPENACRQFGPEVPEDTSLRPADPDVTGGYYQPLRVLFRPGGDSLVPSMGRIRIHCGLPGASVADTTRYNRNYHLNTNPVLDSVNALLPSGPSLLQPSDANPKPAPLVLAPGQVVTMRAAWPICPLVDGCGDGVCGPTETKEMGDGNCAADCSPTEKLCAGAERFLVFSLETRTLDETREIVRVSWFAGFGGGSFANDRTGRDANDLETTTDNDFTAPTTPGVYPIWAVIRDDRGGQSWKSYEIQVQ